MQMALFSILKHMGQYDKDNVVPLYGFRDEEAPAYPCHAAVLADHAAAHSVHLQ